MPLPDLLADELRIPVIGAIHHIPTSNELVRRMKQEFRDMLNSQSAA